MRNWDYVTPEQAHDELASREADLDRREAALAASPAPAEVTTHTACGVEYRCFRPPGGAKVLLWQSSRWGGPGGDPGLKRWQAAAYAPGEVTPHVCQGDTEGEALAELLESLEAMAGAARAALEAETGGAGH